MSPRAAQDGGAPRGGSGCLRGPRGERTGALAVSIAVAVGAILAVQPWLYYWLQSVSATVVTLRLFQLLTLYLRVLWSDALRAFSQVLGVPAHAGPEALKEGWRAAVRQARAAPR